MLPIAHISPTSVLRPIILTRRCVLGSMTMSALLVNCGGVALASYLISSGINCLRVSQLPQCRLPDGLVGDPVHGPRRRGAEVQLGQRSRAG